MSRAPISRFCSSLGCCRWRVALELLAEILGAGRPPGAGGLCLGLRGRGRGRRAALARRARSAVCTLIAGLAGVVALEELVGWVFRPTGSERSGRCSWWWRSCSWVGALRVREGRARHAVQLVNAAGMASLVLGLDPDRGLVVTAALGRFGIGSESRAYGSVVRLEAVPARRRIRPDRLRRRSTASRGLHTRRRACWSPSPCWPGSAVRARFAGGLAAVPAHGRRRRSGDRAAAAPGPLPPPPGRRRPTPQPCGCPASGGSMSRTDHDAAVEDAVARGARRRPRAPPREGGRAGQAAGPRARRAAARSRLVRRGRPAANWEQEGLGADGVVTGMGTSAAARVAVMANDPTVKAGSWGPKTVEKILRIQERALSLRVPMVYLVDSAGARITEQVQMFPGPSRRRPDLLQRGPALRVGARRCACCSGRAPPAAPTSPRSATS